MMGGMKKSVSYKGVRCQMVISNDIGLGIMVSDLRAV